MALAKPSSVAALPFKCHVSRCYYALFFAVCYFLKLGYGVTFSFVITLRFYFYDIILLCMVIFSLADVVLFESCTLHALHARSLLKPRTGTDEQEKSPAD